MFYRCSDSNEPTTVAQPKGLFQDISLHEDDVQIR